MPQRRIVRTKPKKKPGYRPSLLTLPVRGKTDAAPWICLGRPGVMVGKAEVESARKKSQFPKWDSVPRGRSSPPKPLLGTGPGTALGSEFTDGVGESQPASDAQFLVQIVNVVLDRLAGNEELGLDVLVGLAQEYQS